MKMTQCQKVAQFIRDFGSITPMEAIYELGVMRLAARINDLEKAGFKFEHKREMGINRYGQPVWFTRYKKVG